MIATGGLRRAFACLFKHNTFATFSLGSGCEKIVLHQQRTTCLIILCRVDLDLAGGAPPVQIAFEFAPAPFLDHDVTVDVKFYFNYMEANETYYDLQSTVPVRCQLDEFCHRK